MNTHLKVVLCFILYVVVIIHICDIFYSFKPSLRHMTLITLVSFQGFLGCFLF